MTDTPLLNPDGFAPERDIEAEAADQLRGLLIERSLYAKINGDEDLSLAIEEILKGAESLEFDQYCVACGQITPWTIKPYQHSSSGGGSGSRYTVQYVPPKVRVISAVCLRKQHFYTYIIYRDGPVTQKIGQRPSLADIAHGELKAIAGIGNADRKELGRALGLYAHDTPLGAFVYLRRVFERMVERAHKAYEQENGGPVVKWTELRMGERIAALGDSLPGEVSSNAGVFGLLSKGIHELSDEDADTLFPLLKAVIFQMLGDEERHRQSSIARKETNKALQAAVSRYNPPKPVAEAEGHSSENEGTLTT